jgi:hypothetical protein
MAVTITRTAWIDDDGSGTTGTVINNAEKTLLYNQIDEGFAKFTPGQTPAAGTPIDHAFTAGDYTGSGGMTWTLGAPDFGVNSYALSGKSVTWYVNVGGTLGGTASNIVYIKLPGGLANGPRAVRGNDLIIYNSSPQISGQLFLSSNVNQLNISRADGANFSLGSVTFFFTLHFWIP